MPWDFSYWSEKYQKEHYELDEELLKPYFQLEAVQAAVDAAKAAGKYAHGAAYFFYDDVTFYQKWWPFAWLAIFGVFLVDSFTLLN